MDKPPSSAAANKPPAKPAYISSSGHVLESYVACFSFLSFPCLSSPSSSPPPLERYSVPLIINNLVACTDVGVFYLHTRPPLSARLSRFSSDVYNFLGLYFVSLFSLDPYTAAQNSQFNTRGRPNAYQERPRWAGGSSRLGGAGGGPSGGGGGGSSGRRMGGIDDVRAPECGSCG
jgi:uncharacterized membrane protein YgcG